MKQRRQIFVFGSNMSGIHGAGAAAYAHKECGAEWGVGEGLTGDSYALPTKGPNIEFIPFKDVIPAIDRFVVFATENPDLLFLLTPVGCGLAGFDREQVMAALEKHQIPDNIVFVRQWVQE